MNRITTFLLAALLFIWPSTASAQLADDDAAPPGEIVISSEEEPAAEDVEEMEPVVVTATTIETPISKIGSSTTVITKEDIERQGATEVLEVLRNVPGVNTIQGGSTGGFTSLFMRGGESNFTLVMIDGVKINDDGGAFNFAQLTTDNVARIEVIRGPQSALYGADAMTGVVNIITKKGEGPPTLTASSEVGTNGTFRHKVSLSGSKENMDYSLSASHYKTSNLSRLSNDDYENVWLSGRVGFALGDDADLSFIVTHQDSETGLPGATDLLPEDTDDEAENQQTTFAVIFDQYLTPWWEHVFQYSYFIQDYENVDPSFSFFTGLPDDGMGDDFITEYLFDLTRYEVNYQHNFYVEDTYVLSTGVDWMEEQADIYSYFESFGYPGSVTDIDKSRTNRGFFAQVSAEYWERLNLVVGARYDDNSTYGSEWSPRVTASYLVKATDTRIKGSYGEGIKNPSFFELYLPFGGNPDLDAEKSESWDIGVEQRLTVAGSDVFIGATYFDQKFDDMVNSDPITYTLENIDEAVVRGIEIETHLEFPCNVTLAGAYTYLIEAKIEGGMDDGKDLLRRPDHLAAVTLNYNKDKLNANLNITYTGERRDSNPVTFAREDADDFTKVDLAFSYDLNDHIQLIGLVENLLDEDIEQTIGFESTGITFLGGVRGTF